MTAAKLLEYNRVQKIGRKPVVVLPLAVWSEIENRLEDFAALQAKKLRAKIAKARAEKKLLSSREVKKLLRL